MNMLPHRLWRTPDRLAPQQVKVFGSVAIGILMLAVAVPFLYEGLARTVHASAFALLGLANLALALGSILPEERGGEALRKTAVLLVPVTLLALIASNGIGIVGGEDTGLLGIVTSATAGFTAATAFSRRRPQ